MPKILFLLLFMLVGCTPSAEDLVSEFFDDFEEDPYENIDCINDDLFGSANVEPWPQNAFLASEFVGDFTCPEGDVYRLFEDGTFAGHLPVDLWVDFTEKQGVARKCQRTVPPAFQGVWALLPDGSDYEFCLKTDLEPGDTYCVDANSFLESCEKTEN